MARDNGRGGEFIKKRKYSKAKYCFECGVRVLEWVNSRRLATHRTNVLGTCLEIDPSPRRRFAIWERRVRT